MIPFGDFLQAYFQEVCEAKGVNRKYLRIADCDVVFQFSIAVMADAMTAAMAHLEIDSHAGPAALTVSMWDGKEAPRNHVLRAYLYTVTNWWFSYTGTRGVLLDMHNDRLLTTYNSDTRLMCVIDLDHSRAFYWKSDTAPVPYYELCSPFRSLLHGWMSRNGRYFVHGAAVGHAAGGVMMVGKGGSGKSTSALSCLTSSLGYVGDDYCIVTGNTADGFEVHSLYCTAKVVEEKNLEAFPSLAGKITNPERIADEKVALSLNDYTSSKLMKKCPLRAVLVPQITGKTTTSIEPCQPQEAMMAIAPTTVGQMPFSGAGDLRFMAQLVRTVPTYRLMLGTKLDEIPGVIEELLASSGDRACRGRKRRLNSVTNERPKRVTVIAPARNATAFYPSWLRAIEAQAYDQLEAILVDDGSDDYDAPDGLRALVEQAPPFVRYLRTDGVGPAQARNLAISASDGNYVAFLDLDDLWAPGHLQRLVSVLEAEPDAGIVQGQIRKIMTGDDGELLYCSNPYNFVNLGAGVYRRSVFERVGLFDSSLRFGEDFDHIVRCWELGILKLVLPDVSLLYHRHDGNMTNGKSTVDLGAVRVYKRRLDRMRQGLVDPILAAKRQVSFGEYLGTTVGPFDEGVREPVEL